MKTEKRLFIFLLVSLGTMLFFSRFSKVPPGQTVPEAVPGAPVVSEPFLETKEVQENLPEKQFEKINFNKISATVCLTGGYVSNVHINEYNEDLLFENLLFLSAYADKEFTLQNLPEGFRLTYKKGSLEVIKEIRFIAPYLWEVRVESTDNLPQVTLFEQAREKQTFYQRYQEIFYKEGDVARQGWPGPKKPVFVSNPSMIGARDRYFAAVILDPTEGDYAFRQLNHKISTSWKPPVGAKIFQGRLFIGPQKSSVLEQYDIQGVINFGFFHAIGMILLKGLVFFHSVFRNWGVSIISVSILIYVILFPLTSKSTKSMRKMQVQLQEFQPKIDALRKKYSNNPQKLQKETMELYKKHNINPLGSLGGCLPMVLQIPVFFSLYQVLNRLVEIKGASFLWIRDLSLPDYLIRLPFKLPFLGDGIHLLPILTALIMLFQQKLTMPQSHATEQQKLMGTIFPIMITFIFYRFPSGLVLYWVCNYLFTFLYQLKLARAKTAL